MLQGPPHLINSLHGEVEGHELKDRPQVVEGSSYCESGKAHLSDWCVWGTKVKRLFVGAD